MTSLGDRLPPALRGLLRQKRFSALAIVSLGVAIALNTTMYSVTDALLFPRVDMRAPQDLYLMPFYGDYRQRLTAEQKLEAIRGLTFYEDRAYARGNYGSANLAENGSLSKTARVLLVSSNYFTLLGVTPLAGRLLGPGDENSPANPVVVSERFWKYLFPDRDVRDTVTFTLDGAPRTVVGVLGYGSDFPGRNTEIWQLPTETALQLANRGLFGSVYRLKSGLSIPVAYAELEAVAARLGTMAGDGPNNARFDLERLVDGPMRVQNFHLAIIGAVAFVLLVACFNLANLQLARGLGRTRELATRAAVGATRRDLVSMLVQESAWIAGAGLALGVVLTFWGIHLVQSQVPPTLEDFLVRPQVSWRLFVFATITSGLALAIVGLIPAIRVSRVDVNELLKSAAGTGSTRRSRWHAGSLVVLQVGLALALMAGASLLIRAAASLYRLDINPMLEKVAAANATVRPTGPNDRRTMADASGQLAARAAAIPGVLLSSTLRSVRPDHSVISVDQDGALPREIGTGLWSYRFVSPDYLRLLGMKVTKGRDFIPGETDRSVILDAQTARFLWPANYPIGRQVKFGSDSRRDAGWFTVVGVAEFVNVWSPFSRANQADRTEPRLGAMWVLSSHDTVRVNQGMTGMDRPRATSISVYVRGSDRVERLPSQMRQLLGSAADGFGVVYAERLQSSLQLDLARQRQDFVAALFTAIALLALGLSSLGVYAVVSHTVSLRTREFGVRVALGASQAQIRQSVLEHGNVLALSGIAVGLVISWLTTGTLSRFALDGDVSDVLMFALAAVVLFAATLLASYVPARRAMRVNPVEALRAE